MEAARRYYAFDLAPSFWDCLTAQAMNGRIRSVDRVKAELDRGKDQLKDWADGEFHLWFESTDQPDVIDAYGRIMEWAGAQEQYRGAAKAEFARADNADAWVVAYSLAKGCILVTHEQPDPNIKIKIPIPNVCQSFGIPFVDTFRMLRDLGVRIG